MYLCVCYFRVLRYDVV